MFRLPVIVGFGGFNAAGRSSFHHAYQRMILESLPEDARQNIMTELACMMKLVRFKNGGYEDAEGNKYQPESIEQAFSDQILNATLVRKIESQHYDCDAMHWQSKVGLTPEAGKPVSFVTTVRQVPQPVPSGWQVSPIDDKTVKVEITDHFDVFVEAKRDHPVKSAGQLPTGFNPGELYNSRFHPRGLQMAVVSASDAINSVGIDWQTIVNAVEPDQIGVYASSSMAQLDESGFGGMLQSRLKGSRVSSKQCPLGMNSMPADFINAYLLGNVGSTNSATGACASFLYNLNIAVDDIREGRRRVVLVGTSEAPVTPEIIDGYGTMGALATEENLLKLDQTDSADFRRSSRPFGNNCGFTMAESAQFFVLMDDELAVELGADIYGAIPNVFINADGHKKSISAPGPGNYITMAKAVAAARSIVGDEAIQHRSFIQAHGSSTPQNRVTESHIFDQVAEAFGISSWPVSAVKSYIGHSLASASADQLSATLGIFAHGWIPGVKTIDKVADDVYADRLEIPLQDTFKGTENLDVAFINSKGFGGNNATAAILSPSIVEAMLSKRYGAEAMADFERKRSQTQAVASQYDQAAARGEYQTIYKFGQDMIDEKQLSISDTEIRLPGFSKSVNLDIPNYFDDMI